MHVPREGNELDEWARRVLPRALAYARSLVRNDATADDVVQECFCRLIRRAGDYDLPRDGVRLLFRAISNLCINQGVRRRNLASLDTGGMNEEPLPVEDRLAELPPAALERKELQEAIDRALERLPPMQRAALELRALGQGKAEIAEVLQVSESNAGVLVYRARQALAEMLAPLLKE